MATECKPKSSEQMSEDTDTAKTNLKRSTTTTMTAKGIAAIEYSVLPKKRSVELLLVTSANAVLFIINIVALGRGDLQMAIERRRSGKFVVFSAQSCAIMWEINST